jgi:hypothetical protein
MSPDDNEHETRFKCPNCQQPIVSRFTFCKQCETKFGRDTLFSCPRCGALVRQLERVCPGCEARLTDWGVGAEWLGTPLASASQKVEAPKETEPGPIISRPLPELKKPEQVEQSPKPAPAPTPLPEIKKPDQPDRSQKLTSTQTQKPAPSKITRAEALGRTNGLRHGRVNGTKQGLVNGTNKGRVNGTRKGLVNGTNQGLVNGNRKGLVNGTKQGRVNGFKGPMGGEQEESSFLSNKIAGKVPTWQALAAVIVVILLVSSAVILSIKPQESGLRGIVIDGQFADWATVSSYRLSDLLPGSIPQVIEAKMNRSGDNLNLYMKLQANAFSGTAPSVFYVMIDTDSDVNTGYLLADHRFGADRLITLSGWDGHLMESFDSNFSGSSDASNWSAWQSGRYVSVIQSQAELELSLPFFTSNPLVRLITNSAGKEYESPVMSLRGTIIAKQESLLSGLPASSPSQSIIRVSMIAMGVTSGNFSATATIANDTSSNLASAEIQVSSSTWTSSDFSVDLSSLTSGASFSMRTVVTSSAFSGSVDVDGDPINGYYLSIPTNIVIDGAFGDWASKKIIDTDPVAVDNPNIDIAEYGACTQNGSHFFYVSTVGKTLDGADVPEERIKPTPGGGGNQSPVVRLRKTGEDLLQAFIDRDPGTGTGQILHGGGKMIGADYMVEIYGRKGLVTSSSVKQWSNSTHKWAALGGIEKIGIGGKGIEYSVAKSLLGNLTASEIIFYTTDWKARSDSCWLTGTLKDPWIITSSGSSYQSVDGITWASSGSITLQGSGSNADTKIVDMIANLDRNRVWAVSDHGRIYTNVTGSNTWTTNLTNDLRSDPTAVKGKPQGSPISDVIAITNYPGGGGANYVYLLTQRGYIYYTKSGIAEGDAADPVLWKNDTRRVGTFTDFDDFIFASPNYYAMRSGSNTPLYYGASTTFTATTVTGSSMTQTHMEIYPGASQATDTIFVLTDHGDIRRSTDGGTSWNTFGNLPHPTGGNASTVYVGIALDPSNIIWVVTDNGWVYKSTTTLGGTFVKTQKLGYTGIVAIVGIPIPEFSDILIPILTMVIPAVMISRNRKKGRNRDHD